MKKTITLLLAILCALSLAACAKVDESDPIIGTWETKIAHSDLAGVTVEVHEGIYEYMNYDDIYKTFTYEFDAEGYYTETVDVEGYIADYKAAVEEALYAYYEAMIIESGLTVTVEEAIETDGVSVDDYIDRESLEALRSEDAVTKGKYMVDNGRLYLSAGMDYEVDESVYISYTIDGDTLTMTEQVDANSDDTSLEVFPLQFTKLK